MIVAGIFDKLFSPQKDKIQEVFENLVALGYAKVPTGDGALLASVRQLKPIGGGLFVVRNAVGMQRGGAMRYVSDLQLRTHVATSGGDIAEWTIITQNQPLPIKAPFNVTPRTIAYEMLFKHTQAQEEIIAGAGEKFVESFYAFSKTADATWVPDEIQALMVERAPSFPFKALNESIAIAHFSPKGWSILCDRVKNAGWFNDLLKMADDIEVVVGNLRQE